MQNRALATCNTHLVQPQSRQCATVPQHSLHILIQRFQTLKGFEPILCVKTSAKYQIRSYVASMDSAGGSGSIRLIKTQQKRVNGTAADSLWKGVANPTDPMKTPPTLAFFGPTKNFERLAVGFAAERESPGFVCIPLRRPEAERGVSGRQYTPNSSATPPHHLLAGTVFVRTTLTRESRIETAYYSSECDKGYRAVCDLSREPFRAALF
ncbi:hypothetical protein Bbelb_344330 [Branchiostoma belcheri]|nr:hypothetical protein Bbelb_344330 [Branchiostoma belcheri]